MLMPLCRSQRFILRPITVLDATPEYLRWLQDERANKFIVAVTARYDLESLRQYIEEKINRDDVIFLGIFVAESGAHIGNIKFEPVNRAARSATMGMLIGCENWRGKGVAAEVLDACAIWLYERHNIVRIELGVDRQNDSAIKAYQKAGFKIVSLANSTSNDPLHMIRCYETAG